MKIFEKKMLKNQRQDQSYLVIHNINTNTSADIIMFDLDDTIIKFDLKSETYKLVYNNTIKKLAELSKNNTMIIISNQKQIRKPELLNIFMKKIAELSKELCRNKIFVDIYVSTTDGLYRKPNTGMIEIVRMKHTGKLKYYCGDALGRIGDFNDTDFKFGLNLGINVCSPEEIFLNEKRGKYVVHYPILNKYMYSFNYIPCNQEMVIMVGYPGSGKSSISNDIFGIGFVKEIYYKIINRDNLKSIDKCIKETVSSINNGMNIIIDNTNPTTKSRKIFIDIAKKYNYSVTVVEVLTSYEESMHNNYYRHIKYKKELIPEIAYRIYKSTYDKPTMSEGINKILSSGVNIFDPQYNKFYF